MIEFIKNKKPQGMQKGKFKNVSLKHHLKILRALCIFAV